MLTFKMKPSDQELFYTIIKKTIASVKKDYLIRTKICILQTFPTMQVILNITA